MRRALAAVVVLPVLGVLVTGCGSSGSRAAVLATGVSVTSLSARHLEVRLPDGVLEVRLGRPTDSLDGKKPPSGWSYVPVGALLDASTNVIGAVKGVTWGVVADGRTLRLPAPYTKSGSGLSVDNTGDVTYVPVPDHGREVTVSVTYDGVTQTASTTGKRVEGAARPYYVRNLTGTFGTVPVSSSEWKTSPGKQLEVGGTVQSAAAPYLPGQGWAKAGRLFVGIAVVLQEVHATGEPLSQLELKPTLDGSTPIGPTPASAGGSISGTYWFDVSSTQVHVLGLSATYGGITGTKSIVMN